MNVKTKTSAEHLKELTASLARSEEQRQRCLAMGKTFADKLAKACGDYTGTEAEVLAAICHQYSQNSNLCIEWMMDHFMGLEFVRHYPLMKEIYKLLVKHNHHERNKFDYFNDAEAFYIPHKNKMIFVCGKIYKKESRFLIIDQDSSHLYEPFGFKDHSCYVRKIWRKLRRDCIKQVDRPTLKWYREKNFELRFRDSGDRGHVLTFEDRVGEPKCDNVHWDYGDHKWFFFEMDTLHTQITHEKRKG